MTQNCRPAMCIEAIRVALLDECTLLPVPGEMNGYAMGCIIEPNWTPEIEEGEESIVKDNCGNICLRNENCDLVKRYNLEFKIKDPDKEFLSLIEGNPLIVDDEGNSIGVRQLSYGACSPYLFLEMFERTEGCDEDGDPIYYRHIFPAVRLKWTGNEREGVFRLLQIEGKTKDVLTDSIGAGPFDDIPLDRIAGETADERTEYVWFEDDFLPDLQCGAIEVPFSPGYAVTSGFEPGGDLGRFDFDTDNLGRYLVAARYFDGVRSQVSVRRFLENGDLDTTFGVGGMAVAVTATEDEPYGIAVNQSDNSMYVMAAQDAFSDVSVMKFSSAGILVGAFGTAGVQVVQAGAYPIFGAIFVESTGNVALASLTGGTDTTFDRISSVGAPVDDYVLAAKVLYSVLKDGSDGNYIGVGVNGANIFVAKVDIDLASSSSGNVSTTAVLQATGIGTFGFARDAAGNTYIGGYEAVGGLNGLVARVTSLLALDAGFGTAGYLEIEDPLWAVGGAEVRTIVANAAGTEIIATGRYNDTVRTNWFSTKFNAAGVVAPAYGTAGLEIYNPEFGATLQTVPYKSKLDEANGKVAHVGFYEVGADIEIVLARTRTVNGALDPSFG